MSSKPSDNLQKYLLLGGGLAASYFLVHYLASRRSGSSKSLSLETTLTLLREIKYQVYASCIAFAEGVNAKLKANYPAKDLEVFLRTELAKTYESKEELILTKHMVSRDQYEIALKKHKRNAQVAADQAEIIKVLQDSVRGQVDLSVPPAASRVLNREQLLAIYREVCEEIGVKVWQKLVDCKRNNPGFDSKNDKDFKVAIRELGIYEYKVSFLREKGLRDEWGCPNLNFLKLLEEGKRQSLEVRAEANYIEKGYEVIIAKVSNDLEAYDRVKILRLMEDTINDNRQKNKPQAPVAPARPVQAPAPPQPVQKKPVVAAKPKQEEEQFDLEKMMMEELLSRSQEQPKAQRKEQVQAEVKVEAAVVEAAPEVKAEPEAPQVVEIVAEIQPVPTELKEEPAFEVLAEPEPVEQPKIPEIPVEQPVPACESVAEPEREVKEEAVAEVPREQEQQLFEVKAEVEAEPKEEVPAEPVQIPEQVHPQPNVPQQSQPVAQQPNPSVQ